MERPEVAPMRSFPALMRLPRTGMNFFRHERAIVTLFWSNGSDRRWCQPPKGAVMTVPSRPKRTLQQRPPSGLAAHAEAARIPVMPEEDYRAFRADVDARGLRVPIEINDENVVLDGRQRLRAARDLGHESVQVRIVEAADEVDYMLRAAVLRRHLQPGQRAALVVEFEGYDVLRREARERQRANLRQASEVATLPPRGKTRDAGAHWAGVSARTV